MSGDDGVNTSISIHALRVEGDKSASGEWKKQIISIHALRVEGDLCLPSQSPLR